MVNIWKRIKAWHKNLSTEARFLIAESIFCISLSIVIICIDLSDGRPIEVMTIVFGFLLPMCYKFFTESINIMLEQRKNIDDVFEKYKEEIEKKTNAVSKAESKVANITKSKSQSLINKANDVLETAKKTLEIAHNNRQKEVDLAKKDIEKYFSIFPPVFAFLLSFFIFLFVGAIAYNLTIDNAIPGKITLGSFYAGFLFGILGPHVLSFFKYKVSKSKVTK